MAGESSLVNLTGSPSTWILEHLLQREQVDPGANCHTFTINTKYFNADVNLNIVSYKDVTESSDVDHFEKTEALLLYCEGTTVCFDKAEEVWQKAKCSEPAVRLCIVDSTKEKAASADEVSRTDIVAWCLRNQFELIECDEQKDEDIEDQVGKDRILEALRSHTWSSMQLVQPPQNQPASNGESASAEESVQSFESLFSELWTMKEASANLPPAERRAYAEKVALAFYTAMGSSDSEEESEQK